MLHPILCYCTASRHSNRRRESPRLQNLNGSLLRKHSVNKKRTLSSKLEGALHYCRSPVGDCRLSYVAFARSLVLYRSRALRGKVVEDAVYAGYFGEDAVADLLQEFIGDLLDRGGGCVC